MKNSIPPEQDIVFAEEVNAPDGKYLVTLLCGHEIFTNEKKHKYPCTFCLGPSTADEPTLS